MSSNQRPLLLPLFSPRVNSDWQWERLDSVSHVYDCPHSTPHLVDDVSAPYVARSQDVRSGTFLSEGAGRVSPDTYIERIKRAEPRYGDLLYSREGTYFGIAAEVPPGIKVCLGQRMVLIRPDSLRIDHRYLKYWLNSPQIFRHIHGFRDGTVAERLNLPVIRGLPIAFPPLAEQHEIANVLSVLDDRIALLRETNATLEAIAQALFKSWFVDFDPVRAKEEDRLPEGMDEDAVALFPDSFEESELGPVPRGWRVGVLEELCQVITNGGTPSRSKAEFWEGGSIPWFKTGDFSDGFLLSPSERITESALKSSAAKLLPENAVLMAIYAAPTVGRLGILTEPATFNQACTGMVAKENIGPWYLYWTLYFGRDWFNSRANGAAQQNISKAIVASYRAVIPPGGVLAAFNEIVSALHSRIRSCEEKAATLSNLRDTLLPRLISGQLRLPEVEAEALAA